MKLNAALLLVSPLTLIACASVTEADKAATVRSAESLPSEVAGTWRFDLDASDVAPAIREQCAKQPDPKQCWDEIAAEARLEKVRFSDADASGRATWTSFAADPKGDVVFVRVPVDLVSDGAGRVLAKIAGPPTGSQAAQLTNGKVTQLRVALIDGDTIAIDDPKKGRLVYAKE